MPDRSRLTVKQLRVLKFIEQEVSRTGDVPTFRAIAENFELKAVGTVQDYITKLIDFGFLEKEKGKQKGFKLPHQSKATFIPILGSVPAGKPLEAVEDCLGSIALAGHWKGDCFALQVKGESMRDRGILDGDFVVVKKQADAETGEIVVAQVESEATVKILEKKNGKVRLIPANSNYKPIEINSHESSIVGKVIAVQRLYRK